MFRQFLQTILFATLVGTLLLSAANETLADVFTWTDENGVTHFSDKKPGDVRAGEHEEAAPAQFTEEAAKSYERRYDQICGDASNLNNASETMIDIYVEQVDTLKREVAADVSLPQQVRTTLQSRLDACIPRLFLAKETAQRRELRQEKVQDVLQQKMHRFNKLEGVVAERLEQRRSSSMAGEAESAKFYSDLKHMGDNPLRYGMTMQDVGRLWGEPLRSQMVKTRSGRMNRVSYPMGIDLYFRDGLLETWGWRE